MVDWSLARRIARLAAGGDGETDLGVDLGEMAARSEQALVEYTGLRADGALPPPEAIGRAAWAEVNLTTMASLLDPVAERLDRRMAYAGPLAGPLRLASAATLAAESGLVMGYLARRVLGQYELSLLGAEAPPRLLLVAPNLRATAELLDVDRASFVEWVVLHEITHALQFAGAPWLGSHLGGLLEAYLASVEVRIERGAAGALPSMPDPSRLVEAFQGGGLAALVQTREERETLDRIQATMAVVEGYAELTMDAVAAQVLPGHEALREAMERRRQQRSAPERVLARLLGLDMKLRQYRLGRAFCLAVVDRHGIERLNRVWAGPEALPTLAELSDAEGWAERVRVGEPSVERV